MSSDLKYPFNAQVICDIHCIPFENCELIATNNNQMRMLIRYHSNNKGEIFNNYHTDSATIRCDNERCVISTGLHKIHINNQGDYLKMRSFIYTDNTTH
jgi:hypothetical protein